MIITTMGLVRDLGNVSICIVSVYWLMLSKSQQKSQDETYNVIFLFGNFGVDSMQFF